MSVGVEFDAPAEEGEDCFEELLRFQAKDLRDRGSVERPYSQHMLHTSFSRCNRFSCPRSFSSNSSFNLSYVSLGTIPCPSPLVFTPAPTRPSSSLIRSTSAPFSPRNFSSVSLRIAWSRAAGLSANSTHRQILVLYSPDPRRSSASARSRSSVAM